MYRKSTVFPAVEPVFQCWVVRYTESESTGKQITGSKKSIE